MPLVLPAVLLFGLVHPGAKWLMQSGIGLLPFCLFYVGIRLLVQIPLVIRRGIHPFRSKIRADLAKLSLVGALLPIAEFSGISNGLPVSAVTLLVYTHPVWTLLFDKVLNRDIGQNSDYYRVGLALIGVALIAGQSYMPTDLAFLLGPLAAGVLIASWVYLSNRATKRGASTLEVSFHYDLFAFLSLLVINSVLTPSRLANGLQWLMKGEHAAWMTGYSILLGLLPNYLFYSGSKHLSAISAALLLLFEPIVSSLVSVLVWSEPVTIGFALGATCLCVAVLPIFKKADVPLLRKAALGSLLLVLPLESFAAPRKPLSQENPTLHVVELVAPSTNDYSVSSELKQIEAAVDLAVAKYKRLNAKCDFKIEKTLGSGTEEDLFARIKGIPNSPTSLVIGFSRSNLARVAAKAATGSKLTGVSIGAATSQLRSINPEFLSIVNPWEKQWKTLKRHMKRSQCVASQTMGVFDSKDHLSTLFKDTFVSEKMGRTLELGDKLDERKFKCLFVGMNFSSSQPILSSVLKNRWPGIIYGIGDWNIYSDEIKSLISKSGKITARIYAPTGWRPTINGRSVHFAKSMRSKYGTDPSPIGAYAFDTTLMSISSLCEKWDLRAFSANRLEKLPLLRVYEGLNASGNYLSKMYLVNFKGEE